MVKILNALSDNELIAMLKSGGVGVLPTDTVYGLVCCAGDELAVARLYKLKSRENKPGTVVASNIEQLVELGIKARYLKAVEQFWPNPITIIIPCGSVLDYLDQSLRTLAVRVSKDAEFNKLIDSVGPLLTSSANLPDEPPARTIAEAQKYFGEQVEFYVDGGDLSDRSPSTLIRIVDDAVEVLRNGTVKIDEKTGRIL